MIRGHGGNTHELAKALGCRREEIIDMSSNVNPFGPPPGLLTHLGERLSTIGALPEVDARSVVERFADFLGIAPEQVAIGNGTTQLIYDLPRALDIRQALIVGPTYADYRDGCARSRVPASFWLAPADTDFQPDLDAVHEALAPCDTVYICNPNNPTGALVEREGLQRLCGQYPMKRFIVDESYLPFVKDPHRWTLAADRPRNVVVLQSMSKMFRIPGLRIGFAVGEAGVIDRLRRAALPWSVNSLALEAVHFLLAAGEAMERFVADTRAMLAEQKTIMMARLAAIPGLHPIASATGFILIRLPATWRSDAVCRHLARERILLRDCSNFEGLSHRYIRISLQDRATNLKCADALASFGTGR
jgi:threonine-phosphate decarboxylase